MMCPYRVFNATFYSEMEYIDNKLLMNVGGMKKPVNREHSPKLARLYG